MTSLNSEKLFLFLIIYSTAIFLNALKESLFLVLNFFFKDVPLIIALHNVLDMYRA